MLDMAEVIQIFLSPSYVCKHGTRQKGSYGKPDTETAAKKKRRFAFIGELGKEKNSNITTRTCRLTCKNKILWIIGRIPNPVLVQGRLLIGNNNYTLILSIKAIAR